MFPFLSYRLGGVELSLGTTPQVAGEGSERHTSNSTLLPLSSVLFLLFHWCRARVRRHSLWPARGTCSSVFVRVWDKREAEVSVRVCGCHGESRCFYWVANPSVRSHGRSIKQRKCEKWRKHTKGVETFGSVLRVADPLLPPILILDCCFMFSSPNNFHINLGWKNSFSAACLRVSTIGQQL